MRDPQWVGAWWLGFVICSIGSIIWAVPMLLFPPVLKGGAGKVISTKKGKDVMTNVKGTGRLCMNDIIRVGILESILPL